MGDWLRLLRTCTIPTLLAATALAHEDDPKLWALRPPHQAKPVFTTVPAGMPMASSGTPRAMSSNGISLLSNLPLSAFGATSGADCWGYTSPSGREIALIGHSGGVGFVDISDPRHPVVIYNATGPNSLWRDVEIFGHHVYAVSEGGSGVLVYDMSNVDNGVVTQVGSITTGGTLSTHTVIIDTVSGYLYRCGGGSNIGLRIYDLNANPVNPPLVGQWLNLYVHEVLPITYTSGPYAGKQIAFACSGTGNGSGATRLSILDVTNKSNITLIREVYWPGAAYSHQCWVSDDRQYLYLDDELDEPSVATTVYVMNISNLATASLVGSFTNGNTAIGHNLYVKGNRIYAANYRSGVRIFDRTNPINCTEIAHYDTFPADDAAQFNGLWGVYPFFASGVLIGSDLESGLFVWWVGATPLDIQLVQGAPNLLNPGGQSLDVTILENTPGAYVAGSAKLVYDAGAGAVIVPLASLGGSSFRADFPALPCGTNVSWYLEAESSTGLTWTYPEGGASAPLSSIAALGTSVVASNEMETAVGWVSGDTGDNATSGQWLRADPVGTAAQPEDDHSATGVACWVTGNAAAGASIGTADVDGGTTTLLSANYNLTGLADPVIGYWRWYSNNQNGVIDDTFVVQVRNGGAWVTVETVGPTGIEATG
ncbi:MAG: choice-of-anchor B family protein, partial [Planctomycetota bacterium]|nr:choice-of-anchor B family protein [Planctomycetota bacterium]